ncbi:MAG: hypothetical protein ACRDV2_13025, partial [Actinomycetes bacterium]
GPGSRALQVEVNAEVELPGRRGLVVPAGSRVSVDVQVPGRVRRAVLLQVRAAGGRVGSSV